MSSARATGRKRYFDAATANVADRDLQPVKLKRKSQQNFKGDFVVTHAQHKKEHVRPFQNKRFGNDVKPNPKPKKPKVPQHLLDKYSRGGQVMSKGVKTKHFQQQQKRKEVYLEYAEEQAARTELLLQEAPGMLEADKEEITANYRQAEIAANLDLQSAAKHFQLNLDFGPYTLRYTKNGRHLLLGGRRGHVAAFDWITKRLHCEFNATESVVDVQWLHVPTMYAVAQKEWVYFYDKKGTELHCVKRLTRVNRLDFLPYHFLLAAGNSKGFVSWLDVSIGELVGNYNTGLGDIRLMRHNPANGVLCIGGGKGVVSMWSPKVREPLAKMLCHPTAMTALTVDPKGQHLVTAGLDRCVKVWDIRQLNDKPLAVFRLRLPANEVEVSQRGVLALSQGTYLEMYTDLLTGGGTRFGDIAPYLRHRCDSFVHCLRFCPYEDILGVATATGFQSLLAPGSGEPNFDALEDNPYETRKQRREHEVHALLEKIPPELITLDPEDITAVDAPTLEEKIDAKRQLFHLKPPRIDMKTRHKMKGRGGTVKAARNKQIVKDQKRKEFIADIREAKKNVIATHRQRKSSGGDNNDSAEPSVRSVLDRFKPKYQKKQKHQN
ncbi:probable U3 small nucleolar RNA-associated protein 7 [Scaptodrosophila lebanonensis]|uniref:Probable U3 small nucleolar RNA-associated protein 7 n=1 Tax=Drosophila lebanonensis TaxID=7225 RepID=A0A6J2TRE1_DROLE|nr:probable U3 small nucleolar RNA-associated protein 7 [Scaptodrosophila lebanonensis]